MNFDGPTFIRHLADRLIAEFQFSSIAGTPGLVGAAKEHPARKQLERLMPGGIRVGSGIIVDSYGGVSRQQDIVIYESLCPVFTTNDTPEATFYPVEGVVAVGEVKSSFGKAELKDAAAKIESVKSLCRRAEAEDSFAGGSTVPFRHYGNGTGMDGTKDEEFDQGAKSLDQVFGFVLCQKFSTGPDAILANAVEICRTVGAVKMFNLIVSLENGFIAPHKSVSNSVTRSFQDSDSLVFCGQSHEGFSHLLSLIRLYVNSGRTVERKHFERYFRPMGNSAPKYRVNARVAL